MADTEFKRSRVVCREHVGLRRVSAESLAPFAVFGDLSSVFPTFMPAVHRPERALRQVFFKKPSIVMKVLQTCNKSFAQAL